MSLTKKQRQKVWAKSNGRCWYCGEHLPDKGWHADHVEPVYRVTVYDRHAPPQSTSEMRSSERDSIKNIVPACAPCNRFKSTHSVEDFRYELEKQVERARKSSVNFRNAERFGLIRPGKDRVVFWFEQAGLTA